MSYQKIIFIPIMSKEIIKVCEYVFETYKEHFCFKTNLTVFVWVYPIFFFNMQILVREKISIKFKTIFLLQLAWYLCLYTGLYFF